ncbi:MAG: chaperone modulator CbpM [Bacteriovorax sp.]|nr:chaperone modulator CbpM [Bacteriovorax sp.]
MRTTLTFEIAEAAHECGINQEAIIQFINFEWIQPVDPINLLLDKDDIARIQLISELKDNLGVNDESIPIILHLIDQLNHLHQELIQKTKRL